ncbi:MAG: hypothetical protein GY716_24690 [bacterium]|nr:hypothetical protein [bacterium]
MSNESRPVRGHAADDRRSERILASFVIVTSVATILLFQWIQPPLAVVPALIGAALGAVSWVSRRRARAATASASRLRVKRIVSLLVWLAAASALLYYASQSWPNMPLRETAAGLCAFGLVGGCLTLIASVAPSRM